MMPVKCDRCQRHLNAPVPREWLLRLARSKYPVLKTQFLRVGRESGDTVIRISPLLCPGNVDSSCLAMRTPEYRKTWENIKPLPGINRTDQEWLKLGFPPKEGLTGALDWQERLTSATVTVENLSKPWIRYLSWRFAWHLFWHHKGLRHENAKLERMWGNVAADVLLWQFRLLDDEDLVGIYCTSVVSLLGMILCHWHYGLAIVETFSGIRRDLGRNGFNPLKSAIQRADTAMRKFLEACIGNDRKEQGHRRETVYAAFCCVEYQMHTYGTLEQHEYLDGLRSYPLPLPSEAYQLYSKDVRDGEAKRVISSIETRSLIRQISRLNEQLVYSSSGASSEGDEVMSSTGCSEPWREKIS